MSEIREVLAGNIRREARRKKTGIIEDIPPMSPAEQYVHDHIKAHCAGGDWPELAQPIACTVYETKWVIGSDGNHFVAVRAGVGDESLLAKDEAVAKFLHDAIALRGGIQMPVNGLRAWCLDRPWNGLCVTGRIGDFCFDRRLVAQALWPADSKAEPQVTVSLHPHNGGHYLRVSGSWWLSLVMSLQGDDGGSYGPRLKLEVSQ